MYDNHKDPFLGSNISPKKDCLNSVGKPICLIILSKICNAGRKKTLCKFSEMNPVFRINADIIIDEAWTMLPEVVSAIFSIWILFSLLAQ